MTNIENAENEASLSPHPCLPSLVGIEQVKNRLQLAQAGRKLMHWTALTTGQDLKAMAKKLDQSYKELDEDMRHCYLTLARSRYSSPFINDVVLNCVGCKACTKVCMCNKLASGVQVMHLQTIIGDFDNYCHLGISRGGEVVAEAKRRWQGLLKKMVDICTLRTAFRDLDVTNRHASKQTYILNERIIPSIKDSVSEREDETEDLQRLQQYRTKIMAQKNKGTNPDMLFSQSFTEKKQDNEKKVNKSCHANCPFDCPKTEPISIRDPILGDLYKEMQNRAKSSDRKEANKHDYDGCPDACIHIYEKLLSAGNNTGKINGKSFQNIDFSICPPVHVTVNKMVQSIEMSSNSMVKNKKDALSDTKSVKVQTILTNEENMKNTDFAKIICSDDCINANDKLATAGISNVIGLNDKGVSQIHEPIIDSINANDKLATAGISNVIGLNDKGVSQIHEPIIDSINANDKLATAGISNVIGLNDKGVSQIHEPIIDSINTNDKLATAGISNVIGLNDKGVSQIHEPIIDSINANDKLATAGISNVIGLNDKGVSQIHEPIFDKSQQESQQDQKTSLDKMMTGIDVTKCPASCIKMFEKLLSAKTNNDNDGIVKENKECPLKLNTKDIGKTYKMICINEYEINNFLSAFDLDKPNKLTRFRKSMKTATYNPSDDNFECKLCEEAKIKSNEKNHRQEMQISEKNDHSTQKTEKQKQEEEKFQQTELNEKSEAEVLEYYKKDREVSKRQQGEEITGKRKDFLLTNAKQAEMKTKEEKIEEKNHDNQLLEKIINKHEDLPLSNSKQAEIKKQNDKIENKNHENKLLEKNMNKHEELPLTNAKQAEIKNRNKEIEIKNHGNQPLEKIINKHEELPLTNAKQAEIKNQNEEIERKNHGNQPMEKIINKHEELPLTNAKQAEIKNQNKEIERKNHGNQTMEKIINKHEDLLLTNAKQAEIKKQEEEIEKNIHKNQLLANAKQTEMQKQNKVISKHEYLPIHDTKDNEKNSSTTSRIKEFQPCPYCNTKLDPSVLPKIPPYQTYVKLNTVLPQRIKPFCFENYAKHSKRYDQSSQFEVGTVYSNLDPYLVDTHVEAGINTQSSIYGIAVNETCSKATSSTENILSITQYSEDNFCINIQKSAKKEYFPVDTKREEYKINVVSKSTSTKTDDIENNKYLNILNNKLISDVIKLCPHHNLPCAKVDPKPGLNFQVINNGEINQENISYTKMKLKRKTTPNLTTMNKTKTLIPKIKGKKSQRLQCQILSYNNGNTDNIAKQPICGPKATVKTIKKKTLESQADEIFSYMNLKTRSLNKTPEKEVSLHTHYKTVCSEKKNKETETVHTPRTKSQKNILETDCHKVPALNSKIYKSIQMAVKQQMLICPHCQWVSFDLKSKEKESRGRSDITPPIKFPVYNVCHQIPSKIIRKAKPEKTVLKNEALSCSVSTIICPKKENKERKTVYCSKKTSPIKKNVTGINSVCSNFTFKVNKKTKSAATCVDPNDKVSLCETLESINKEITKEEKAICCPHTIPLIEEVTTFHHIMNDFAKRNVTTPATKSLKTYVECGFTSALPDIEIKESQKMQKVDSLKTVSSRKQDQIENGSDLSATLLERNNTINFCSAATSIMEEVLSSVLYEQIHHSDKAIYNKPDMNPQTLSSIKTLPIVQDMPSPNIVANTVSTTIPIVSRSTKSEEPDIHPKTISLTKPLPIDKDLPSSNIVANTVSTTIPIVNPNTKSAEPDINPKTISLTKTLPIDKDLPSPNIVANAVSTTIPIVNSSTKSVKPDINPKTISSTITVPIDKDLPSPYVIANTVSTTIPIVNQNTKSEETSTRDEIVPCPYCRYIYSKLKDKQKEIPNASKNDILRELKSIAKEILTLSYDAKSYQQKMKLKESARKICPPCHEAKIIASKGSSSKLNAMQRLLPITKGKDSQCIKECMETSTVAIDIKSEATTVGSEYDASNKSSSYNDESKENTPIDSKNDVTIVEKGKTVHKESLLRTKKDEESKARDKFISVRDVIDKAEEEFRRIQQLKQDLDITWPRAAPCEQCNFLTAILKIVQKTTEPQRGTITTLHNNILSYKEQAKIESKNALRSLENSIISSRKLNKKKQSLEKRKRNANKTTSNYVKKEAKIEQSKNTSKTNKEEGIEINRTRIRTEQRKKQKTPDVENNFTKYLEDIKVQPAPITELGNQKLSPRVENDSPKGLISTDTSRELEDLSEENTENELIYLTEAPAFTHITDADTATTKKHSNTRFIAKNLKAVLSKVSREKFSNAFKSSFVKIRSKVKSKDTVHELRIKGHEI